MLTASGTLTINAAFLQEIKEDNRDLPRLLDEGRRLLCDPQQPGGSPRRVARLLHTICDQLALHFTLEEAFGYFEDAVEAAPRLSRRAGELRAEHGELFSQFCEVVEQADQLMYRECSPDMRTDLSRRYEDFHGAFRRHEESENELIQSAFDEDIGVGD